VRLSRACSVWGDTPLYASEGSLCVLSCPSGRGNGSPAVFRHPLPLGTCKTRRNCWCSAGVLLANCLHSACIRAPFLCPGSVRRFAPRALRSNTLSTEPRADRRAASPKIPRHARPCASVGRARAIHRVLCVSWRLRASWSLLERHSPHCAPSFMGVHGSQYPQHYSSRPSRTLSTLRMGSACQ
jgi:hypothetical protein